MTNLSSRIYSRLLVLYPDDLRRDFGADMASVFAEDFAAARRRTGIRGAIRVWRCALMEFVRFALPGAASSPAVRVPAIAFAFAVATLSAEIGLAPGPPSPFQSVARLLLTFSTLFIALVCVWACRGRTVTKLNLSNYTWEED